MPITHELDRDRRLVRAAVRGDFTADEMLRTVSDAARAERWALGAADDDLADGDAPPHPWPAAP